MPESKDLQQAKQVIKSLKEQLNDYATINKKLETQLQKAKWKGIQRINKDSILGWKTACWDLETTGLAATFGRILCASIKPLGGEVVTFRIDQDKNYDQHRGSDRWVVKAIRDELMKYNILVAYNTINFDLPFLQTRLLKHGLSFLPPLIKHVDPLHITRYRLRLHNNDLNSLLNHLRTRHKKTPLLADLWGDAAAGDKKALDKVVTHNIKDVEALEEAFQKLLPFIDLSFKLIR